MSNVVSISCTCDYMVKRAARHRRAGRYDEAMALLWKAHNQFGLNEDVQLEMAGIYDEIGCEAEAARAYLRIVRLGGSHRALALFHLALSSAQHGDIPRALSYFERYKQSDGRADEIPHEMSVLLGRQLRKAQKKPKLSNASVYARALEQRAASSLQAGRLAAARRAVERALRIRPTAQRYTMLACCHLLRMDLDAALEAAKAAHVLSPANVQTLCVLCDAYAASGEAKQARKALALAALRARQADDLLSVSVESAKLGNDALTLRLTKRLLKKAPFHTRAMLIRACALINSGKTDEAVRLLGRLCGLMPEDTVCEYYYKTLRSGGSFSERLSLGMDVTRDEGVSRGAELFSMVMADPKEIDQDESLCIRLCRICDWAFHSPMAGSSAKTAALILLASVSAKKANDTLMDALTDPQLADAHKLSILQVLTAKHGFYPYDADIGGRLVRLAAGGVSSQPVHSGEANSQIVQRVSDVLTERHPDAPEKILSAFLAYLDNHGQPDKRHEGACAAALECWYRMHEGIGVDMAVLCSRWGVSVRQMRLFLRRIESGMLKKE